MGQAEAAEEIPSIGIGMLGYAFMGKAHSNALKKIAYMTWPPPYIPRLVAISGRTEDAVQEAARRYGYEKWSTSWQDVVDDPDVQIFDNGGPNDMHAEPSIAAAKAGKHVICEKPLGRTADESYEIWKAVAETGVKHMTAFNYRFYPAIRLAKEMIDAGEPRRASTTSAAATTRSGSWIRSSRRSGGSTRRSPAPARSATSART